MAGFSTITSTTSPEVISSDVAERERPIFHGETSEYTVEQIQEELLLLSLRQADVQKRIRSVQHALLAMIRAFGPEVLPEPAMLEHGTSFAVSGSQSRTRMTTLCRDILKASGQWLTARQIVEAIQQQSPLVLAGFKNPGASVSNALRTFQRRSVVEAQLETEGIKWRWSGEPGRKTR